MPKLYVVIVSTRPGRVGPAIAQWFHERVLEHGAFEVEMVDLAEVNLPLFDEPVHPRLKQYQNQHTKDWSAKVTAADAFVFVTPEYNYGSPPSLINALDYLVGEWAYKPVAFVSYGGLSGGTRSVQMTKQIVTTLKMMPIPEAVNIAFFNQYLKDGVFTANDPLNKSAADVLSELHKWTAALMTIRAAS